MTTLQNFKTGIVKAYANAPIGAKISTIGTGFGYLWLAVYYLSN
jgi:hypothetical protein